MIILNSFIVTKNAEGGCGLFHHPFSCKISKKIERGTLWRQKKFEKRVSAAKKNERGDSFSPVRF